VSKIISQKTGKAIIEFSRKILRNGISANAVGQMFRRLPPDTKVLGIGEYSGKDSIGFLVESSSFKETEYDMSAHPIGVNFMQTFDGKIDFHSFEFSDCLKEGVDEGDEIKVVL
jgi:hypothetical protein